MLKVSFSDRAIPAKGTLMLPVFEGAALSEKGNELNSEANGLLVDFMARREFTGGAGSMQTITKPAGLAYEEIILVGLGAAEKLTPLALEEAGGRAFARLSDLGITDAAFVLELPEDAALEPAEVAARFGAGAVLRDYRFDKYKTENGPQKGDADKKSNKERAIRNKRFNK